MTDGSPVTKYMFWIGMLRMVVRRRDVVPDLWSRFRLRCTLRQTKQITLTSSLGVL